MGLFVSWCTVPKWFCTRPQVLTQGCLYVSILHNSFGRNFTKHLILNYCHLSIRPDLITDAAAQGGSFVYFSLLEQTVEHNQKIYYHFFLDSLQTFLLPQMCDVSLYYYLRFDFLWRLVYKFKLFGNILSFKSLLSGTVSSGFVAI